MASIRKRGPEGARKYDVRWRVGGKNGQQHSRTFIREKDARLFKADIERRIQLGELHAEKPRYHRDFMDAWVEDTKLTVKSPLTKTRLDEIRKHLAVFDNYLLSELTVGIVRGGINKIAATSTSTARRALAMEKRMLRDAALEKQRFDQGILSIRPPAHITRKGRFLSDDEVLSIARYCTEGRLVEFLPLTGLRISEALSLTDRNVNLADKSLTFTGKGCKQRTVYLCKRAEQLLREQMLRRPAGCTLLFPTQGGLRWRLANFYADVWNPAVKASGVAPQTQDDKIVPHDMRHSYASRLMEAGEHPAVVAEQLGHSDGGQLVLKVYGHLNQGSGRKAASTMDARMEASA